jgi:hypothetical protein
MESSVPQHGVSFVQASLGVPGVVGKPVPGGVCMPGVVGMPGPGRVGKLGRVGKPGMVGMLGVAAWQSSLLAREQREASLRWTSSWQSERSSSSMSPPQQLASCVHSALPLGAPGSVPPVPALEAAAALAAPAALDPAAPAALDPLTAACPAPACAD